jgi:hypothetical protein
MIKQPYLALLSGEGQQPFGELPFDFHIIGAIGCEAI